MGIRGYQKFNMLVADDSLYTWASTEYSLLALKSDATIPTGLSTSTSTTKDQSGSTTDATFTKSFIIPRVFDVLSILDGTIEGSLKIGVSEASSTATDYIQMTKVELTIKAIDSSGSSRDVISSTTLWEGTLEAKDTAGSPVTKQLMYWIDIEDGTVNADERLVVEYTCTYTTYDDLATDSFTAYIYCTLDTDETTITLPFVM